MCALAASLVFHFSALAARLAGGEPIVDLEQLFALLG
jgi:hypothetical protein